MVDRNLVREGMPVRTADGEKLGTIVELGAEAFVVEKGLFFPREYTVSFDRVAALRDGEIVLASRREELNAGIAETAVVSPTAETREPLTRERKELGIPVSRKEEQRERAAAPGESSAPAGEAGLQEQARRAAVREEESETARRPVAREEPRTSANVQERRYSEEVRKQRVEAKARPSGKKREEPK